MMNKEKYCNDIICYPLIIFLLLSATTMLILFFRSSGDIIINENFNIYNRLILLLCHVVFVIFWTSIMCLLCIKKYNYHSYVTLVALIFIGLSFICLITYFVDNLNINF